MTKNIAFVLLPVAFLFISIAQPSSASYITISTSASTDVASGRSADLALNMSNLGDETAYGVTASLLQSQYFQSEPLRLGDIRPSAEAGGNMTLRLKAGMLPGSYMVPLLTEYADANGYPFSSVASAVLVYESSAYTSVVGSAGEVAIADTGEKSLHVDVKNLDSAPHDITVTLYLPRELKAGGSGAISTIAVGAKDEKTVQFDVANLAGLKGSSYAVPFLIEYEQGGVHYSSIANGLVDIGTSQASATSQNGNIDIGGGNILFILVGLYVVVMIVVVYYRFFWKRAH